MAHIKESLEMESTYEIKGKRFVVRPVFKETGKETLGSVFLRLMASKNSIDRPHQ